MKVPIMILLAAVAIAGCNGFAGKPMEHELQLMREMNRGLENSNKTFAKHREQVSRFFSEKLNDGRYVRDARRWMPKVDSTILFSGEIYGYIDSLKTIVLKSSTQNLANGSFDENLDAGKKFFIENGNAKQLLIKLDEYNSRILRVDTLETRLFLDSSVIKYSNRLKQEWSNSSFASSSMETIMMLTKLQNDICNSEALALDFFISRVNGVCIDCTGCNYFTEANALYFKPGQELTITAGMGEFTKVYHPIIKIGGKEVEVGWDGTAEYKTKVGKPGKYSKTVEISLIKPDGTPSKLTKTINYEVADCAGLK